LFLKKNFQHGLITSGVKGRDRVELIDKFMNRPNSKGGYEFPQPDTARRNVTTTRVCEYKGRECRPEIFIYARTCRRTEEPADSSIVDVRTEYRTAEYPWSDFKEIPGAKELLGDEWDAIEREDRALNTIWRWLFFLF
jgi:hypothetical protein